MATNINPNPTRSLSQRRRIYNYLQQGNSLTPAEAISLFGTMKLATRISELRNIDGVEDIAQDFVKVKTADGGSAYVMKYYIREAMEEQPLHKVFTAMNHKTL